MRKQIDGTMQWFTGFAFELTARVCVFRTACNQIGDMALGPSSYFGKLSCMMFGSEIYGTRKLKMAPPFFVLILR